MLSNWYTLYIHPMAYFLIIDFQKSHFRNQPYLPGPLLILVIMSYLMIIHLQLYYCPRFKGERRNHLN